MENEIDRVAQEKLQEIISQPKVLPAGSPATTVDVETGRTGGDGSNGWQWVIAVDTLIMLSDNEARVEGVIVQDNKFPWYNEGERTSIRLVKDNGQGAADPPDEIFGVPILGGNFIVR